MEKILAILTKDVSFGHTLAEYILNSHVLKYRVIPFYDVTDYLQFKDSHDVDVLLMDEGLEQDVCITAEGRTFLLTEEKRESENAVFKYQSLEITVKELSFKLYAAGSEDAPKNNRFRILAVASGRGGSGVTTFALTLAGVLGRKQNVLFVSLDPFAQLPPDIESGNGELGELIYGLNAGKTGKNLGVSSVRSQGSGLERGNGVRYPGSGLGCISGCIHHGRDFDHVSGVLTFEDLCYFGREEMRNLLAWLSNDGRYKTIIFDMGNFPLCSGVVLEKSEKIYLVGEQNSLAEEQIERLLNGEAKEKIMHVKVPLVKQFQEGIPAYADFENTELWDFVAELAAEVSGVVTALDEGELRSQGEVSKKQADTGDEMWNRPVGVMPRKQVLSRINEDNALVVPKKSFLGRIGIK